MLQSSSRDIEDRMKDVRSLLLVDHQVTRDTLAVILVIILGIILNIFIFIFKIF